MTRSLLPFRVHFTGSTKPDATFADGDDAHEYARWVSAQPMYHNRHIEISHSSGLVGQYFNGVPTREFRGRGDEHYPAGRLRNSNGELP